MATASTRCSQLSSTSSSCRPARYSASAAAGAYPARSCRPSAPATAWATSASSRSWSSRTSHTPSRNARRSPAAARSASRVLPTPPTPVSVTSRDPASSRLTSASSPRRPTKLVSSAGRFPVTRARRCHDTSAPGISREGPAQALPLNAHVPHHAGAPCSAKITCDYGRAPSGPIAPVKSLAAALAGVPVPPPPICASITPLPAWASPGRASSETATRPLPPGRSAFMQVSGFMVRDLKTAKAVAVSGLSDAGR